MLELQRQIQLKSNRNRVIYNEVSAKRPFPLYYTLPNVIGYHVVFTQKKLLDFQNFFTPLRDITNMLNSNTETLNILIKIAFFLINHK